MIFRALYTVTQCLKMRGNDPYALKDVGLDEQFDGGWGQKRQRGQERTFQAEENGCGITPGQSGDRSGRNH